MITSRNYDYLLGGKDHYAADRAEGQRLLEIYPPLAAMAPENRAFLAQAITWAAQQGITQFLDLGCGLPAAPSTHQIARAVNPAARTAYVDTDPVVLAHARALLATSDGVTATAADLRDPGAVLADPELRAVIDPAQPAAVILGAVLHFLDVDTRAARLRSAASSPARLATFPITPAACPQCAADRQRMCGRESGTRRTDGGGW